MTQSTRLLFRMIRLRLMLGLGSAFVLFLLIALLQPPLDAEYLPLLLFVGLAVALLMRLHTLLTFTMFPITDRQVAWIPLAAWGLASLAGMAGLLLGQLLALSTGRIHFAGLLDYWLSVYRTGPPVLFLLLLAWRVLRLNAGFAGCLPGFVPFFHNGPGKGLITARMMELSLAGWPFWLAGCLFLVWEAPRQTAMLRRFDYQETGTGFTNYRFPQLHGPARPAWATRLADTLMGITIILFLVAIFISLTHDSYLSIRRNPFQLFYLFLLLIPFAFIMDCWRQNHASGMGPLRSIGVSLIELTIVGYVYRDLFGVARSVRVRCPFCGGWRLAWQAACPHCGDRQHGAEVRTGEIKQGIRALLFPRHDPGAMAFRVMIPIYVLSLIIATNWRYWFGG